MHRRTKRWIGVARWLGAVTIALLLAAFVASRFWNATVLIYPHYKISAGQGGLAFISMPAWDPQWSVFTHFDFAELPRNAPFFFWFRILRPSDGYLIPIWFIAFLAAIPTALLWRINARRLGRGLCPNCGYDMAGVDGQICPECGATFAAAAEGTSA